MQYLSWAVQGAAILVALYGLRVAFQPRIDAQPGGRASLGGGFLFILCLTWGLASHAWVNGYLNGFRLGMGVYLLAPALGALRKPHGSRLVLGLVGLVLAVLLAGPVVREEICRCATPTQADAPDEDSTPEEREAQSLSDSLPEDEAARDLYERSKSGD